LEPSEAAKPRVLDVSKIKLQMFWNFIFEIIKTPRVLEVPQNKVPKCLELYFLNLSNSLVFWRFPK
jgi:hypothetical protein